MDARLYAHAHARIKRKRNYNNNNTHTRGPTDTGMGTNIRDDIDSCEQTNEYVDVSAAAAAAAEPAQVHLSKHSDTRHRIGIGMSARVCMYLSVYVR